MMQIENIFSAIIEDVSERKKLLGTNLDINISSVRAKIFLSLSF